MRSFSTGDMSRWSDDTTSVVPLWLVAPPALTGLRVSARSSREQGGKARPPGCGVSPVALHTAVISIPDFVPSMKELNILGFMRPRSAVSRPTWKCSQTVSGVERWKLG